MELVLGAGSHRDWAGTIALRLWNVKGKASDMRYHIVTFANDRDTGTTVKRQQDLPFNLTFYTTCHPSHATSDFPRNASSKRRHSDHTSP